jgi:hypothetical protein
VSRAVERTGQLVVGGGLIINGCLIVCNDGVLGLTTGRGVPGW